MVHKLYNVVLNISLFFKDLFIYIIDKNTDKNGF